MDNRTVTVQDMATPWLRYMMQMQPEYLRKSMKSLGWYMQKEIKAGIKSKSPGGSSYTPFMDPRIRAQLEGKRERSAVLQHLAQGSRAYRGIAKYQTMHITGRRRQYAPMGKLKNAIGYQYDDAAKQLKVGWLSKAAVRLGEIMENGGTKTVTPALRKYYWAHGVPINNDKTVIKIPARPTIEPMRKVLLPQMVPYIEKKMIELWYGQVTSPSATRKYKVWR
jgi:hypothetical protein